MKLKYTVHSAVTASVPVKAKIGEREIVARVDGLIVELVNASEGHTYRLAPETPEAFAAAAALFKPGAAIVVSFEPGE